MQFFSSYTFHDVSGTLLAIAVFPVILVAPGYTAGWSLNLFDFRLRRPFVRFLIGTILSFAISPILFFLAFRFLPRVAVFFITMAILLYFLTILYRTSGFLRIAQQSKQDKASRYRKLALWVFIFWMIFVVIFLVEFQFDNRLYFNVVAYDYSTRVAIINAITQSGVPPVNPGYFPGHPVYLTYLYYFWYILCSMVDVIGGKYITAYESMIASVVWCGLGLMSVQAFYLRLRRADAGAKIWKSAFLGLGLLLVSGADIIGVIISTTWGNTGGLNGDIEHWNEQVTAWIGALSWVPHHVAAMIACFVGIMLLLHAQEQSDKRRISLFIIAGLAFASSFGLSVFVTIVFVVCWGIWILANLAQKDMKLVLFMILSGIIGAFAISPFLADLLRGTSAGVNAFPLTFAVRVFRPIAPFMFGFPAWLKNITYLLALPLNYFFELGYFFYVGLSWYRCNKGNWKHNVFFASEVTILVVVFLIGSFVRSSAISSNDIGWRAWLPGQFILLIWSIDIIEKIANERKSQNQVLTSSQRKNFFLLQLLLIIGLLTTLTDVVLLRTTPILVDGGSVSLPNSFSPDTNFGKRTFAARQFYEYLNDTLPHGTIIQINPTDQVDRTIGLYADQQLAISVHTAFGIPERELKDRILKVSEIFTEANWNSIDKSCEKYFVNVMIINDLDQQWKNIEILKKQRQPFYKNQYYAAFQCGK